MVLEELKGRYGTEGVKVTWMVLNGLKRRDGAEGVKGRVVVLGLFVVVVIVVVVRDGSCEMVWGSVW